MKQSNATQQVLSSGPLPSVSGNNVHAAYIGLDVHKVSISVAIAEIGRQAPEFRGEIPNEPKAIDKLVRQLSERFAGQPPVQLRGRPLWLWDLSPGPGQRP